MARSKCSTRARGEYRRVSGTARSTAAARRQQIQIAGHGLGDARPLDLDHDLLLGLHPVAGDTERRAVHLGDRRGGQRFGVETREYHARVGSQVLDQLRQQVGQRHGRHGAVQLAELGNPLGPQQVGAAGQDLPQLDERGAQFLQGHARLHRRWQAGQRIGVLDMERVAGPGQRIGQAQPAHRIAQPVPHQHGGDLLHPVQVARGAQGLHPHAASIARAGWAPQGLWMSIQYRP